MKNKFEIVEWDSNFFELKVAKVNSFDSKKEFDEIKEELIYNKVELAYVFSEPNSKMDAVLKQEQVFLADEKVTFARKIIEFEQKVGLENIEEYKGTFVTDKMLDIAIQTSEFSRFRIDCNFKKEEFKNLYYQWIKNAVENQANGKLFVFQNKDLLKGLVYLKEIDDTKGSISLIGVDQGYRGEQIGTKLIHQAIAHFNNLGKKEVQVVTQKANVLACNFYTKNGFEIMDSVNVYHLWVF